MHKLDRSTVSIPACLAEYNFQQHCWSDLTQVHKEEIRTNLQLLQGHRCAYCEGPPYSAGHIEHFRRKNPAHFPELTFQWDNLFFACGSQDHCGHYKDRHSASPYNPDHLIKPDIDDPDDFLYFHSSGEVRLRPKLSNVDANRANETIRVFNLNEGSLKAARKRAVRIYLDRESGILETLLSFDQQDREEFIAEECQKTSLDPYCTTIKNLFETVH